MPEQMTTRPASHAERGSLGGRTAAQRMSPEARSARALTASMAGAVATIEKRWDEMPAELRERVLARVGN
jgi:hypothetical protein